ncbi:alpha/beta hydrolase [Clostridium estertheticum]|uniref:alpha/beta fold hydrolase n=1 Tax=Clostridium estertheticum TaxID=238834 RepID=UPI001C0E5123|nr:alpha/beta hydrolase [Clostridium estertheticum]MBU3215691.1 alpha/beta hydrolase [Clostridium estertheticum]WAG56694.1 alpha/beta hydrolase [Clostridium estertheticum]
MSLETKKNTNKIKLKGIKRFRKCVFRALISIIVILLIGFLYEKIGEYNDAKKYSPVGKMITVNNHKINVYSKGNGKVTVVFSSGLSTPSAIADMYPLYNEISKYTKIVVYDRPGHGWSDVTDVPRDTDSMVQEMHIALIESGQKAPYILVGHSFASLQLIRFAQIYKNEVSGLVLIDGGAPEYYDKNNLVFPSSLVSKYKLLKLTGIARLSIYHTNYLSKGLNFLPNNFKQLYLGMALKTMYNKNIIDEGSMSSAGAKTVLANGHLGNLPLRVFTSGINSKETEWENSQEALKKWSTNSMQMVVKGSNHAIHHTYPNVINNEIKKLIKNQK